MGIHDRDYMREEGAWQGGGGVGPGGAPTVIWALIILNVLSYLMSGPMGWVTQQIVVIDGQNIREISRAGSISWAELANGEIWCLLTYQFVHGNLLHLGMNMLILFFLGKEVAARIGTVPFLLVYLIGGAAAALFEILIGLLVGQSPAMVGASGSISAIIGVLAVLMPNQVIRLMIFFVLPVNGRVMKLAWGWVILNLALGVITLVVGAEGVAWMAHAGGTLYGFLHGRYFLGTPGTSRPKRPKRTKTAPYSRRGENPNIIDAKFTDKRPDYNDVLDKINNEGIGALTAEEREILERASESIKGRKKP